MQDLPYQPLRVFISSKQVEFREERDALIAMIKRLPLLAPVVAEEWSPQGSLRERMLADVRRSPIYVGLFGRIYSEPTELEYRTAREHVKREVLIYFKAGAEPEPRLAELVAAMRNEHVVTSYRGLSELTAAFERHLWDAVSRMIEAYMQLSSPSPVPRGGAVSPQLRRWERDRTTWLGLGLPGEESPEVARAHLQKLQALIAAR